MTDMIQNHISNTTQNVRMVSLCALSSMGATRRAEMPNNGLGAVLHDLMSAATILLKRAVGVKKTLAGQSVLAVGTELQAPPPTVSK